MISSYIVNLLKYRPDRTHECEFGRIGAILSPIAPWGGEGVDPQTTLLLHKGADRHREQDITMTSHDRLGESVNPKPSVSVILTPLTGHPNEVYRGEEMPPLLVRMIEVVEELHYGYFLSELPHETGENIVDALSRTHHASWRMPLSRVGSVVHGAPTEKDLQRAILASASSQCDGLDRHRHAHARQSIE